MDVIQNGMGKLIIVFLINFIIGLVQSGEAPLENNSMNSTLTPVSSSSSTDVLPSSGYTHSFKSSFTSSLNEQGHLRFQIELERKELKQKELPDNKGYANKKDKAKRKEHDWRRFKAPPYVGRLLAPDQQEKMRTLLFSRFCSSPDEFLDFLSECIEVDKLSDPTLASFLKKCRGVELMGREYKTKGDNTEKQKDLTAIMRKRKTTINDVTQLFWNANVRMNGITHLRALNSIIEVGNWLSCLTIDKEQAYIKVNRDLLKTCKIEECNIIEALLETVGPSGLPLDASACVKVFQGVQSKLVDVKNVLLARVDGLIKHMNGKFKHDSNWSNKLSTIRWHAIQEDLIYVQQSLLFDTTLDDFYTYLDRVGVKDMGGLKNDLRTGINAGRVAMPTVIGIYIPMVVAFALLPTISVPIMLGSGFVGGLYGGLQGRRSAMEGVLNVNRLVILQTRYGILVSALECLAKIHKVDQAINPSVATEGLDKNKKRKNNILTKRSLSQDSTLLQTFEQENAEIEPESSEAEEISNEEE